MKQNRPKIMKTKKNARSPRYAAPKASQLTPAIKPWASLQIDSNPCDMYLSDAISIGRPTLVVLIDKNGVEG